MLTVSGVSKAYGGRTLFADVSFQVMRGDRIGLVGPNGAGKSTLFSLILREQAADTGLVELQRGVRLGYLPQENVPVGDETVLEIVTAVTPEMAALQQGLKAWAANPSTPHEDLSEAQSRYEQLGGRQVEARAHQVLRGLGFPAADSERPARTLSGGWVMRAHLARLLVAEPDLLLLDEPTNHLDLESLLWFQEHLRSYPGGILTISHDREFLNHLVDSVVEIRQGRLYRYRGNYDAYLEQREATEQQLTAAWKNQQREIARLQEFVDRFGAKNTKASQAQSKLKQIERMEKIEAPTGPANTIDFAFPQPARSGQRVIRLEHVRQAYAERVVYEDLHFEAERGQRVVLVGPNGAGKSTLLKLLAGVLPVQAGLRQLGHNVKSGYYSQYRVEMLHPERTVLEEALDTPQRVTEQSVRTVLGSFLFRGDDVFKPVRVLSGGEKSRLALVKLLLDPPNLLLMDEPTTHLDLSSVDALLEALRPYAGTLIFISHDVYLIRHLANHVVEVRAGELRHFPGEYQYYLDKTAAERTASLAAAPSQVTTREESGKSLERAERRRRAEQVQARARALREHRTEVAELEAQIGTLESRQSELTALMETPATYADSSKAMEINRELQSLMATLAQLNARWEEVATRLSELEKEISVSNVN